MDQKRERLTLIKLAQSMLPESHFFGFLNRFKKIKTLDEQFYDDFRGSLMHHFRLRRGLEGNNNTVLETEVDCLCKLYPEVPREDILQQLKLFIDMPDRLCIVQRLLLDNIKLLAVKRHIEENIAIVDSGTPPKCAKTEDIEVEHNYVVVDTPCTSMQEEDGVLDNFSMNELAWSSQTENLNEAVAYQVCDQDFKELPSAVQEVTVPYTEIEMESDIPHTSLKTLNSKSDFPTFPQSSLKTSNIKFDSSFPFENAETNVPQTFKKYNPDAILFPLSKIGCGIPQTSSKYSSNQNRFQPTFKEEPVQSVTWPKQIKTFPAHSAFENHFERSKAPYSTTNEEIPKNFSELIQNTIPVRSANNIDENKKVLSSPGEIVVLKVPTEKIKDLSTVDLSLPKKMVLEQKPAVTAAIKPVCSKNQALSIEHEQNFFLNDDSKYKCAPLHIPNLTEDSANTSLVGNDSDSNRSTNTDVSTDVCLSERSDLSMPKDDESVVSETVFSDVSMTERFDLVEALHERTGVNRNKIIQKCRESRVDITKKLDAHSMNLIVDMLIFQENFSDEESFNNYNFVPQNSLNESKQPTVSLPRKITFPQLIIPNKLLSQTVVVNDQDTIENTFTEVVDLTMPMAPSTVPTTDNVTLVNRLCEIFPDASPEYIRTICKDKAMTNHTVDELISVILDANGSYPKRLRKSPEPEVFKTPEDQFIILKEFLPDADPDYLRMLCDRYHDKPDELKVFINEAIDKKDYPTLKDHQRKQQLSAQKRQYTTDFDVEEFLKVIPNPDEFFATKNRTYQMDNLSSHYALCFLRNFYDKLPIRTIQLTFSKKKRFLDAFRELARIAQIPDQCMRGKRKHIAMPDNLSNIPLLQEIAYVSHELQICDVLMNRKKQELSELEEAKAKGEVNTCQCCFDEEILPKNTFKCSNGCMFCRDCIVKSTEVLFGDGKYDFPCLGVCTGSFGLQVLQAALPPKFFSKVACKKAMAEVKAAGIDDLETCPFCDFATIPPEGDKVFSCMNPECMKQSCRQCKEPSHLPLRCDEIEKDDDVKARVFIENQMTEAMLRKCYKCGVKFYKEDNGCNKMTCTCGATMCYLCNQPVQDYKHFNGQGGNRLDLCPLYSDTNRLHQNAVLQGAALAQASLGNKDLKIDPTVDIAKHYQERAKKGPTLPPGIHGHPNQIRQALEANLFAHINFHNRNHHRDYPRRHPHQNRRGNQHHDLFFWE